MSDVRDCLLRVHVPAATAVLWLSFVTPATAGLPVLDSRIDRDPTLPAQLTEPVVPPEWRSLWKSALTGPEDDLRREAAEAIVHAQRQGCADLAEFADTLREALELSRNPTVRLTIATALIALDSRASAPELAALVNTGSDRESLVIEPALANWDYAPLREVWLARLAHPEQASRRRLLLAIEGVHAVGESRAETSLRALALDPGRPTFVRLPAATALGVVHQSDVIAAAQQLAADASPRRLVDRLAAVQILGADRTEPAQTLLARLGTDANAAVAAAALQKLLAIDPSLVLALTPELLQRPEAELRLAAARALADEPNAERIQTLAILLSDPHRGVREAVRESLERLAERDDLRTAVSERAAGGLQSSDWRGLEQSARLVGELEHQGAAERLVVLLAHERPEVSITSAWALSRMEVPETLPAILAFAEQATLGIPADPADATTVRLNETQDAGLAHLFELFGVLQYAESEPLLRRFVPRRYDLGPRSRAAAAWALGHLHAGNPQPDVARLLAERVADDGEIPIREPIEVRANAAISLGRMQVPEALEVLRAFYRRGNPGDPVREACGWAIEQITGEDFPDPPTKRVAPSAPFLTPLQP